MRLLTQFAERLRRKKEETSRQAPAFLSWEKSATGQFREEELIRLRDGHPSDLVEELWKPGVFVQNGAVGELLGHGNPRKAALVVRELIKRYPVTETTLRQGFGDPVIDTLTQSNLLQLPSKPSEY